MLNYFMKVTTFVEEILKSTLKPGDYVIDGTAGTGEDTVILGNLVRDSGRVFSFDIQEDAIEMTQKKVEEQGLQQVVTVIKESHENMTEALSKFGIGNNQIKGITFNLGYLPYGNKEIVTQGKTTLLGIKKGLKLLDKHGFMTICLYPGHKEGGEELELVLEWAKDLGQSFVVHHFKTLNRKSPPELVIIQKRR
ncbi:MAG: class I SAM-dependent methyltransferase [Eubacteriaceae bacterium]